MNFSLLKMVEYTETCRDKARVGWGEFIKVLGVCLRELFSGAFIRMAVGQVTWC